MKINCSAPCERDLDLVFIDLLVGWPAFGTWLENQLDGLPSGGEWQEVAHSVVHAPSGESDLELTWHHTQHGRELILIENKINASFQPDQAARYQDRGQSYLQSAQCDAFRTVLFAPASYLSPNPKAHGFNHTLSYEAVLAWITQQPRVPELRLKQELLEAAIEKRRRGYQATADNEVTAFWRDTAALIALLHPQLNLRYNDSARAPGSDALTFKPDGFPIGAELWLRIPKQGSTYVQLLLQGAAEKLNDSALPLGELPSSEYSLAPAGKSAAVRIVTPQIDARQKVAEQTGSIMHALKELEHLRQWTLDRLGAIQQLLVTPASHMNATTHRE